MFICSCLGRRKLWVNLCLYLPSNNRSCLIGFYRGLQYSTDHLEVHINAFAMQEVEFFFFFNRLPTFTLARYFLPCWPFIRTSQVCGFWRPNGNWKTAFLQKVQDSYFFGLCAFTHVARNFMKNTLGWSWCMLKNWGRKSKSLKKPTWMWGVSSMLKKSLRASWHGSSIRILQV